MKDILGVEARPIKETLIDMGHSLVKYGLVKKTKKYKGPCPEGAEEEEVKSEEKEETKEANGTVAAGDDAKPEG